MDEQAIVISDVHYSRDHFALGPINLSIPKGYITAIVGPNGSGKSTLFRMLMNQSKPDKGSISVFNHSVDNLNDDELKQQIGYLNEEAIQFDDGSRAKARAKFHAKWYRNWNEATYQKLIHHLDAKDDIILKKMSKGMRRKFDFTLALAHEPDLLLLDEPSSGLDPIAWKKMIEVLHQYMDSGNKTILMATHIIDEVKRLADFIVFMFNGQISEVYEKDELLQSWATYFIQSDKLDPAAISNIIGYREHKQISPGHFELLSNRAIETEQWLKEHSITVLNKQLLELDEILLEHMKSNGYFTK